MTHAQILQGLQGVYERMVRFDLGNPNLPALKEAIDNLTANNQEAWVAALLNAPNPDVVGGEAVAWRYQHKEDWGDIWRCTTIPVNFETPDDWIVQPLYAALAAVGGKDEAARIIDPVAFTDAGTAFQCENARRKARKILALAQPGDADLTHYEADAESVLAASPLRGREIALENALTNLCDEIGNKELHGDGAHDSNCSICRSHKRARKLLALYEKIRQ